MPKTNLNEKDFNRKFVDIVKYHNYGHVRLKILYDQHYLSILPRLLASRSLQIPPNQLPNMHDAILFSL
jgi:hypothetical protein